MTPLIEAKNLSFAYHHRSTALSLIENLNLKIFENESVGVIGESGSGKSTLGKLLLGLLKPSCGTVLFKNASLSNLSSHELKPLRKQMQMVFQNPFSSLNPSMTIQEILKEPFTIHKMPQTSPKTLLEHVHLCPSFSSRYPNELSGGQRQRVAIARALALSPSFLVCDEILSALDLNTQEEILSLLSQLTKERKTTYFFISHDISALAQLVKKVCVMYFGSIVEEADVSSLLKDPLHPYTRHLLDALPVPDPKAAQKKAFIPLKGELPSLFQKPQGCPFQSRCPKVHALCKKEKPPLIEQKSGHSVACHLYSTL